jgi:hypothetical protein
VRGAIIVVGACSTVLALAASAGCRATDDDIDHAAVSTAATSTDIHPSFLYGRVTTDAGGTFEGRLRWGGDQEAFWGDYFNGLKNQNPWIAHLPPERRPAERRPMSIFGFAFGGRQANDVRRPFMARFGDIARVEALGFLVRVTLKSGTVVDLDRNAANDLDDGVRVWAARQGLVDLESWAGGVPPPARKRIRVIEFLPGPRPGTASDRLHGTVRTRHGEFTGFVQWDRQSGVGDDVFDGRTGSGETRVRFDTIRSIARHSSDSAVVTLRDGREVALSGTRDAGAGNRGLYVEDRRFGRVLISWDAFERVDFTAGGGGPGYAEFPPGQPLRGSVATRDGGRLTGRLVYDLDESEITETLDAPSHGVDYTIPFGMIASVMPAHAGGRASVRLHSGETLPLERAGDLGDAHAGLLIFVEGSHRAEYVPWTAVDRIDFDRPLAMYPPPPGR